MGNGCWGRARTVCLGKNREPGRRTPGRGVPYSKTGQQGGGCRPQPVSGTMPAWRGKRRRARGTVISSDGQAIAQRLVKVAKGASHAGSRHPHGLSGLSQRRSKFGSIDECRRGGLMEQLTASPADSRHRRTAGSGRAGDNAGCEGEPTAVPWPVAYRWLNAQGALNGPCHINE